MRQVFFLITISFLLLTQQAVMARSVLIQRSEPDLGFDPRHSTVPRPVDANANFRVNVGDAVHPVGYIFSSGSPPSVPYLTDVNADCDVNVGNALYLNNFVFNSGPDPLLGCVE